MRLDGKAREGAMCTLGSSVIYQTIYLLFRAQNDFSNADFKAMTKDTKAEQEN